jgi:hypothetical protein
MALDGTYSGLQASIAAYLNRDDLTAVIPDFIIAANNRIGRRLRVADMETTATGSLTDGAAALPDDFIELRRVENVGSSRNSVLTPLTPGAAGVDYEYNTAGVPNHYTITGNTITTYPNAGDGELRIIYYAKPPALSDDEPTNWLLTKAPEIYLYASLIEAAPYLMDDERVGIWGTMFNQACDQLQARDDMGRWGGSRSRVNPKYLP